MAAWWSDSLISATVNEGYVIREIGSKKNQDALRRPLAFGDSLTDDTYLDWILDRGRRFFLILNAIGIPDAIFSILDQSFVDDDLPLSQNDLWEQNLFGSKSETMDRKFYREQFKYLIKDLRPGGHVEYEADDIVPLEPVAKRAPVTGNSNSDKVIINNKVYARKKISTSGDNGVDRVHFSLHLTALSTIRHAHIVEVWATYSKEDFSYMLLTPATDLTLKIFLEDQPKPFKQLDKAERRALLLRWIHCLSSALAYLHGKGFLHSALRPSSILIDENHTICITDYSALKLLDGQDTAKAYKAEVYEHAAPEIWSRRPSLHDLPALKTALPGGGRTARRLPPKDPLKPPPSRQTSHEESIRPRSGTTSSSSSSASKPRNAIITTFHPPGSEEDASCPADVFSLSTLIVLVVSLALSHTPKAFAAHRCRLNRQAGRGGAPPDASFHVNLGQVFTWIDTLQQEAKVKSKKDKKSPEAGIWSAIAGMTKVCRKTLRKDPRERLTARELEKETRHYLDKGLGVAGRWCCGGEEQEIVPGVSFDAVDGSGLETEQKRDLVNSCDPKALAKTKGSGEVRKDRSRKDLEGSAAVDGVRSARLGRQQPLLANSSSSSLTIEPASKESKDGKGGKTSTRVLPKPKPPLSLVAARIAREKEDLIKSKQALVQEQHDLVKEKRDLAEMKKTIAMKEREIQKQEEAIFLRPDNGRTLNDEISPVSPSRTSTVDGTSAVLREYDSSTNRSLSRASTEPPTTAASYTMHHSVLTERTSPPPIIPEEEDSLSDDPDPHRTRFLAPSDDEWPLNNNNSHDPQASSSSASPDTPTGSPSLDRARSDRQASSHTHQSNAAKTLHAHNHYAQPPLSSSVDALRTRPLPDVPPLNPQRSQRTQQRSRASSVNMPPPVISADPFEKLRKRVERAAKEDRLRTLEALEGGPRSPAPLVTYAGEPQRGHAAYDYDIAERKLRDVLEDKVDVEQGEVEWLAL